MSAAGPTQGRRPLGRPEDAAPRGEGELASPRGDRFRPLPVEGGRDAASAASLGEGSS